MGEVKSTAPWDAGEELLPIIVEADVESTFDGVVLACPWFARLATERHARLGYALASLAMIARLTSRDHIFPGVKTTARARNHVVNRQVGNLVVAILTCVVVAHEDFAAGEFDARSRSADQGNESDDRRHRVRTGRAMEHEGVSFEYLGFPTEYQHHCPPGVAHIEWFVVLVQNQYGVIHPADLSGQGCRGLPSHQAPGATEHLSIRQSE